MLKILKFLAFLILFSNLSNSQTLEGILLDRNTKKPLELASVYFKESGYTIFSNSDGRFSIEISVSKNEELIISSIGYEDLVVKLKEYSKNEENQAVFFLVPKNENRTKVSFFYP